MKYSAKVLTSYYILVIFKRLESVKKGFGMCLSLETSDFLPILSKFYFVCYIYSNNYLNAWALNFMIWGNKLVQFGRCSKRWPWTSWDKNSLTNTVTSKFVHISIILCPTSNIQFHSPFASNYPIEKCQIVKSSESTTVKIIILIVCYLSGVMWWCRVLEYNIYIEFIRIPFDDFGDKRWTLKAANYLSCRIHFYDDYVCTIFSFYLY